MLQTGTRGNPNAKILIVGEAYGSNEDREGQPFVGSSGKELDNILLEAGVDPASCYYTNVVNKKPDGNNMVKFFIPTKNARAMNVPLVRGLYPDIPVLEGLMALEDLIGKLKPELIIAFGNYALWALTESDYRIANGSKSTGTGGYKIPTGIVSYRGSQLRSRFNNIPVLATYHPTAVMRNWKWRFEMVHDIRARVPKAFDGGTWDEPERNYTIRPTLEQVLSILNNLILRATMSAAPITLTADIETLRPHIECVGIAWNTRESLCIPIMCSDKWDGYWSAEEEVAVVSTLKRLLEHTNVEVVGQNFFYDIQYLFWYWGIQPNYRQDTMLAHHTCYPGMRMGLDFLSSLYCNYHRYWKDDGKEATKEHNDEQRWVYNCRDCVVTYEVIEELWKVIAKYGLERQYAIQMVRANSAVGMMLKGIKIDERRRGEERLKHINITMEYQAKLEGMLPESVYERQPKKAAWYSSPQQKCELFYDILGQEKNINRDTGAPTVNDDALNKIGNREPLLRPLTNALREYTSLETFGQFINMRLGPDHRMRANFSPTTETFRYRSSEDVFGNGRNLQNLPKGTEE